MHETSRNKKENRIRNTNEPKSRAHGLIIGVPATATDRRQGRGDEVPGRHTVRRSLPPSLHPRSVAGTRFRRWRWFEREGLAAGWWRFGGRRHARRRHLPQRKDQVSESDASHEGPIWSVAHIRRWHTRRRHAGRRRVGRRHLPQRKDGWSESEPNREGPMVTGAHWEAACWAAACWAAASWWAWW